LGVKRNRRALNGHALLQEIGHSLTASLHYQKTDKTRQNISRNYFQQ
jgi:hypothetical protein